MSKLDLPTLDEILASCDVSWLNKWRDYASDAAKMIETDLEFASGDDLGWEIRAKKALAYNRIFIGHVTRRLKSLTGKRGPTDVESRQLSVEDKKVRLSQRELNAQEAKIALEKRKLSQAEKMDYALIFMAVCKKHIQPEKFAELAEEAARMQRKSLGGL